MTILAIRLLNNSAEILVCLGVTNLYNAKKLLLGILAGVIKYYQLSRCLWSDFRVHFTAKDLEFSLFDAKFYALLHGIIFLNRRCEFF